VANRLPFVQRRIQNSTEYDKKQCWILPLSLPQTAFTRLYNILRQNPESLENTGISLRAFTAFYTYHRIRILLPLPKEA
jgi:hypothetical protein